MKNIFLNIRGEGLGLGFGLGLGLGLGFGLGSALLPSWDIKVGW